MNVRVLTLFDVEPLPEVTATSGRHPNKNKDVQTKSTEHKKSLVKEVNKDEPIIDKQTGEKNYYTIGETANKFKVRTSHIRFWTTQFAIKVRTTRKGDRLYTPENIELLSLIHELVKVQGFTIAGAKTKLKEIKKQNYSTPPTQIEQFKSKIKELQSTLLLLKQQIEKL